MKKIFSILLIGALLFAVSNNSQAQVFKTNSTVETLTNADTAYITFSAVEDGVVSLFVKVTKTSGTVAGTIWLEGSVDGTNWESASADTLALANQTTNFRHWAVPENNKFMSYRVKIITTGTQVSVSRFSYLRRRTY